MAKRGFAKTSDEADMSRLKKAGELTITRSSMAKSTSNMLAMKMKLHRHSMKLIKMKLQ
jgi:hypothetical protein